ncbi:GEgh16 protein [Cordyceps javanica]|uniref:GEgh16 protein n=1 Tax=Cordyceps javanica TaxID=43265 RepID=A0A545VMJ2_9HYPO|nr:GEgh16 protein [Cordyceps javanica]TQW02935.1 GEgh16 protein [Cordyceps javanica]
MMRWTTSLIAAAPLFTLGAGHAVILNAQGIDGSPASVGFQVDPAVARNCITINPCQQDTTIIRDAEIVANVVNQCGRTELKGNIDVGENTENAIAANAVTQVKAGTDIAVTIHQVNADGAGPFFCDIDQTSNTGLNLQNLTVVDNVPGTNGLSQAKTQAFNVTVKMPDNLKCTGGSTGNICTVRCRNNAIAGPFGGCFPVQQVDTDQAANNPSTIQTAQKLNAVLDQVQVNQADFGKAVDANKAAGTDESVQNLAAVNALLSETVTSKPAAVETPAIDQGGNNANNGNANNKNGNANNKNGNANNNNKNGNANNNNKNANANGKNGNNNNQNGNNNNQNGNNNNKNGNANNQNGKAGNGNANAGNGNANAGNANAGNGKANAGNGNAGNAGNANAGNGKGNAGNGNAGNGNAGNGNAGNGNAGNAGNANAGNGKGNAGNGNAGNAGNADAGNGNNGGGAGGAGGKGARRRRFQV